MMNHTTVELSKKFEHRYKFGARIYNIRKNGFEDVTILMIISKKMHTFRFREDPPENLPNKTYIYQNFFNKAGKYICVQDSD